jgi:hypothetical protein
MSNIKYWEFKKYNFFVLIMKYNQRVQISICRCNSRRRYLCMEWIYLLANRIAHIKALKKDTYKLYIINIKHNLITIKLPKHVCFHYYITERFSLFFFLIFF